jgi:GT2 family glycosyltransferase/glycosyltransferase involved in cell wall biosynthesis/SAM-dependent methyltransferase
MKINFLLPGTTSRWKSGGLDVMLKLARFVGEMRPAEVVTYSDREDGRGFLDDALAAPEEAGSVWVMTTGIDVPALVERLAGRRLAYYAQETGWRMELPPEVAVLCTTRYALSHWCERAPANPVYLLPVALDPDVAPSGARRDIDVLYLARKTTPYLHEELVPALREKCRVETVERFVPRGELLDLYNRSRVYLYDSSASFADGVVEGIGLQPLEALVCGCTVFSNVVGGMSDYLDPGVNCRRLLLRPERDASAVLAALSAPGAAGASNGAELARRYSEAALRERIAWLVPELEALAGPLEEAEAARLRARARASAEKASQPLYDEIRERGRIIENLQAELHAKIAERDETIRDLQEEMTMKILDRDHTILELQAGIRRLSQAEAERDLARRSLDVARADLQRIYDSRLWKTATSYWSFRARLRGLFGGGGAEEAPAAGGASADERSQASEERPAEPPSPAPVAREDRHDVVCFPIIDWDFRFQRPQQTMSLFARAGHRVFYVAQKFRAWGAPYEIARKADNVYEVSLRGPNVNVYTDLLRRPGCERLFESLDALRRDLGLGATAAVVQLPFWWPLARRAREAFGWPVIYDCMDHHAGFTTNRPKMLEQEGELRREADLVAASSRFLEKEAREENRNVLLVRNACDYPHFERAAGALRGSPRPVVGYYGAIADWFDSDLVADLAERRPDWDFLLVGSTYSADLSRLSKLPNVRLPGEKPYAEIPDWLAKFDAAIIPFRRIPLTEATNPVKAYEIFAAGKPLVAVPLPEIAEMAPHARLAATAAKFETAIEEALREAPGEAASRQAFARENTWEKRFEVLAPAVAAAFPKASVVVVTYNSLPLNRLCLDSLLRRTEWPNFELFFVDNASTDGTRDFLREAEPRHPEMRVILNDENLGFAAANNLALREASGRFLALLNNDTVVSRGWLSTLIRHLQADRGIGLVGPVTNEIGNEARVPVGYERIDDMPAWAARYVRNHDDQKFAIPMLAMFCVAMPRAVFDEVGPLDERFGIGMFEDDDYTHRVRQAGFRIVCCRDSFVHHWMKASFNKMASEEYRALFERNRRLFEDKWSLRWVPHGQAPGSAPVPARRPAAGGGPGGAAEGGEGSPGRFEGMSRVRGLCNICGAATEFYFESSQGRRESMFCGQCRSISRYRSIARGILTAIREQTGVAAESLAALAGQASERSVAIYDTQVPFSFDTAAYPIPDVLARCPWIEVHTSRYCPDLEWGMELAPGRTNQNLERLTFPDGRFDIVVASDVLEHVRVDERAFREIARVLRPGGHFVFTVPHYRQGPTIVQIAVPDPGDPSRDEFRTEPEYHSDANSGEGGALSYRIYGTDLDDRLRALAFDVRYFRQDAADRGIADTELFLCRRAQDAGGGGPLTASRDPARADGTR